MRESAWDTFVECALSPFSPSRSCLQVAGRPGRGNATPTAIRGIPRALQRNHRCRQPRRRWSRRTARYRARHRRRPERPQACRSRNPSPSRRHPRNGISRQTVPIASSLFRRRRAASPSPAIPAAHLATIAPRRSRASRNGLIALKDRHARARSCSRCDPGVAANPADPGPCDDRRRPVCPRMLSHPQRSPGP